MYGSQCSPYQAVTNKIYLLKQHFLLAATAWSVIKIIGCFKNTQVVIQADSHKKRK